MAYRNFNNKKMTIKKFAAAIMAAALVMGLGGCDFSLMGVSKSEMEEALKGDGVYKGVTIEGIDVSGLNLEECVLRLKEEFQEDSTIFTAAFDNMSWNVTPGFLGTGFDYEAAAKEALGYAREGSLKENYKEYLALQEEGADVNLGLILNDDIIKKTVDKFVSEIDREAVDAVMEKTETTIKFTDDVTGYKLNRETVTADLKNMLETGFNGIYILDIEVDEPEVRKADLEKNFTLLGSYETTFAVNDKGRTENIRLASANINGTLLEPGEVFSSYNAMGEQTAENGYKYAGVIENGVLTSGIGGGVCQVSTTLYNAVIRAELEIVERKNHSLKIGYVPAGMDAAIAGTHTDFKFKNNTESPVYIEMYLVENKVYANVYGVEERPENRTVEFETVYISTVPKPAEKITYDPERPEGEREVTKTGTTGSVIDVYKIVYVDGAVESREFFNRSKYNATPDEVTVGQKPLYSGVFNPIPGVEPSDEVGDIITGADDQKFELIINENGEEVYVPVG